MDYMFWVWLGIIVVTAIVEFATMEIASIWFTFGAIIPFIMAAIGGVHWAIQVVVFVVLSALFIVLLRKVTIKFLFKNSNHKTNVDALIGQKHRMLSRTDFETLGSVKINDVVWSATGEDQQTIEKDEIVEIVKVQGNKLVVKRSVKEETAAPMKATEAADTATAAENKSAVAPKKKPVTKTAAKEGAKPTAKTNAKEKNTKK